jgi:hypothetical protein
MNQNAPEQRAAKEWAWVSNAKEQLAAVSAFNGMSSEKG